MRGMWHPGYEGPGWHYDRPKTEEYTDQKKAFERFNELGRQGYTVGYGAHPYKKGVIVVTYYKSGWFKDQLEGLYGVRWRKVAVPIIVVVVRSENFGVLSSAVNEAKVYGEGMGLKVQGPMYFPTANNFTRSAWISIRGPVTELARYSADLNNILRDAQAQGATVRVWLDRLMELVGRPSKQ